MLHFEKIINMFEMEQSFGIRAPEYFNIALLNSKTFPDLKQNFKITLYDYFQI